MTITEFDDLKSLASVRGDIDSFIGLSNIPYALLEEETQEYSTSVSEYAEITAYYAIYKRGASFVPSSSGGDYVASSLRYKKTANLIKKEARFLFSQTPDIKVVPRSGGSSEEKEELSPYQMLVDEVLRDNFFSDRIVKAARDCFIGKRVAILINFNEDGIQINFLDALHFVYDVDPINANELVKFVAFVVTKESTSSAERRIFKKKYEKVKDGVYLNEVLIDGNGKLVEEVTPVTKILLANIPACVVLNDGLLSDSTGVSEVADLMEFEGAYNKIANSDIDAEDKNMNPIRFTVDMESESTKNLSAGAGSYWDLQSDQNLQTSHPQVGTLAPSMAHSGPVSETLKRINTTMHESVDVPDISTEALKGVVASGKTLKAIYWPLIVRCNEKMRAWAPALEFMAATIIEGGRLYPLSIARYDMIDLPDNLYKIVVDNNYPIPEDEVDEKNMDLAEVAAQCRSKRGYMMKWQGLTREEADNELEDIAEEINILENGAFGDESVGELDEETELDEDMLLDETEDDEDFENMVDEELGNLFDEEGL